MHHAIHARGRVDAEQRGVVVSVEEDDELAARGVNARAARDGEMPHRRPDVRAFAGFG